MKMRLFLVMVSSLVLFGCEKSIDFKLKDEEPKLVVEGTIENGTAPVVTLTRSFGYFSSITPAILTQGFVHNADVFVSNGSLTHKLKEYSVAVAPGLDIYYYSTDSSNLATAFLGELNHHYTLRIVADGKEYTATTTIPAFRNQIDSLWWKAAPHTTDSTRRVVMAKLTDPAGYGDYVRYFTKLNGQENYLPARNSVFDDLFIDGTSYEVQIQPGIDRNTDSNEVDYFYAGDTVSLKLSDIDRATYDFWRTWEFAYSSIGDPFSTPTKVLGNISNNALGYFGGYASQYRTLIIPH